jgi:hypothetical protein
MPAPELHDFKDTSSLRSSIERNSMPAEAEEPSFIAKMPNGTQVDAIPIR